MTHSAKRQTLVFADRRGTLSMLHVRDYCSKFDEIYSKFDQFLYCRISSTFHSKFVQKCSTIDPIFDRFWVQLVRNSIEIWVPEFVQISSPQKCLAWRSSGAPGPLLGCPRGAPGARRGRSRSSESSSWSIRVPQEGPGIDFRSKFDGNSIEIPSKFVRNSIKIRSKFD